MTAWSLQDRLAEIINMLLDRHPMGMRVLTGEAPPPTPEEIHEMYAAGRAAEDLGVRVDGGEYIPHAEQVVCDAERFERVVERAGGWPHIYQTALEWEKMKPRAWEIVEAHVKWVTLGSFSRVDDSSLQLLAIRLDVCPKTIQRYRRDFPDDLARVILAARPSLELMS